MKRLYVAITVALALALCAVSAMAWGSATHAYIDEHLNNKGALLKLNQVYGGMAGDVFAFMADPLQSNYLATAAHCTDGHKMWRAAILPTAKAQTYGIISHNQAWGADFFAHNYSCPGNLPPTTGYVQYKAAVLFPSLQPKLHPYLASLGLPSEQEDALMMELLRDAIEYAVDILLIRQDSTIGAKVSAASLLRSPEFPLLLNATFAWDFSRQFHLSYFQATKIISAAELQFRQMMLGYGQILAQGESEAIPQISAQAAALVRQLYGITINPGLIENVIDAAMVLCEPDYMIAINATVRSVRAQMAIHGFGY